MADSTGPELKEYAGGWMSERKHTDVPAFLKFAYIVIALGCIAYGIVFMNGETRHATRGELVRQLNASTGDADRLMWAVAAIAVMFAAGLFVFAFSKPHED